jgi:hypothetical protein
MKALFTTISKTWGGLLAVAQVSLRKGLKLVLKTQRARDQEKVGLIEA